MPLNVVLARTTDEFFSKNEAYSIGSVSNGCMRILVPDAVLGTKSVLVDMISSDYITCFGITEDEITKLGYDISTLVYREGD